MSKTKTRMPEKQIGLFTIKLEDPRWESLSDPVRTEVLKLISQLLARVIFNAAPRRSQHTGGSVHE